jgi:hypothetical protein
MQITGKGCGIAPDIDGTADLAARLGDRLAGFDRIEIGEFVGRAAIRSAAFSRIAERSAACHRGQGPVSNALRAAAMARSASAFAGLDSGETITPWPGRRAQSCAVRGHRHLPSISILKLSRTLRSPQRRHGVHQNVSSPFSLEF